MKVHPKFKRYFRQALTFACIWLFFGLLYCFLELGIMGRATVYPSTGNSYNFKNSLIYIAIGSFVIGALQGWTEVAWFSRLFRFKSLGAKLFVKGFFYLVFLILFLSILTIAINMTYLKAMPYDRIVIDSFLAFIKNFSFWSVIIYGAVIITVALFFSEVNQYLGLGMLRNFFLGTYHRPKKEVRIFMFLDMKSSTTIAEKLGHEQYFELLQRYYSDMTNPILETSGEIYQYVGDEIVVSWPKEIGVDNFNCLRCFQLISKKISKNKEAYISKYGVLPEFKAGYHIGEVTTGEIGDIKKDLIYTGDVLNTAARIQAECNNYSAKVLLSGNLVAAFQIKYAYKFVEIGQLLLRGKQESVDLYKWTFK